MNAYGLSGLQLKLLSATFAQYPNIKRVKLYGSRAKGTFHTRSDIDLVVFGDEIDRFLVADILLELAESDLPYTVDLQSYHGLKNRALIEHINRVGVVIYIKKDEVEDGCSE